MTTYCSVNFPPYCCLFKRREKLLLVGGGGGTARTGVKNFIDVFSGQRNASLEALASIEMADAVMWIGGGSETNRIFYSMGSAVRTAILKNDKLVGDEECIEEALMKTGEFLTAACVSDQFLIIGTNQGRIYLKDLKEEIHSPVLLTRENASIEHIILRDDHFLVSHSNQIMELRWSNGTVSTSLIFFSNSKGRIKRIAVHGEDNSIIFLLGNYLRTTDRRKCRLRSDGTAIAVLADAGLVAAGMLDGHVSVHASKTLDELKVLRPVNSLITSLTFLNEEVSGVELCATSLDDRICRCFVKYGEAVTNTNFVVHIVIMLIIITGHAVMSVFVNPTVDT